MTKPAPAEDQVLTTRSERGTYLAARRLAAAFRGDEVVFLTGELGAGKTVFARGIAAGLGMKNPRLVCSPSYTLINVYQGRVPILHLDLYRLGGQAEIRDLGFEDHLGEAVILIEWGERIAFPLDGIRVHIGVEPDGTRMIRIKRPRVRPKSRG